MSEPKPAATVIVLRDTSDDFEVFLVKRHRKSGFMANAHVYPGGRVDAADCELADEWLSGRDAENCAQALSIADQGAAQGFFVAALREAFEEAGVRLFADANGFTQRELSDWRDRLNARTTDIVAICEAEKLQLQLDAIVPWAHWVTPEVEPKRYDTWFFLARWPQGQTLRHDDQEVVDSDWMTPSEALSKHQAGEIQLAPPTLRTLEELAQYDSIDAAFRAADQTPTFPTIQPHFISVDGELTLLMPSDAEHPEPTTLPIWGSTRMVMRDVRWQ